MSRVAGLAEFPDTVTARGAKHLVELADMAAEGHRAIMVFLVQRGDCESLKLCAISTPLIARHSNRATAVGVEAFAIQCQISENEILPVKTIPVAE